MKFEIYFEFWFKALLGVKGLRWPISPVDLKSRELPTTLLAWLPTLSCISTLKAPTNKETILLRKHCSPEMGKQMTGKQCFLAGLPKKQFPGNKRLHMLNLGNRAYATTESDQHCFLGTQTQKHFLRKQNVSKKSQKHFFVYRKQKCFRNKFLSHTNGET